MAPALSASHRGEDVPEGLPARFHARRWLTAGARWVQQRRALITIIDQGVVSAANLATSVLLGRFGAEVDHAGLAGIRAPFIGSGSAAREGEQAQPDRQQSEGLSEIDSHDAAMLAGTVSR